MFKKRPELQKSKGQKPELKKITFGVSNYAGNKPNTAEFIEFFNKGKFDRVKLDTAHLETEEYDVTVDNIEDPDNGMFSGIIDSVTDKKSGELKDFTPPNKLHMGNEVKFSKENIFRCTLSDKKG